MSTVGFYTDAGEQTNVSASVAAAEAAATASATSASNAATSETNTEALANSVLSSEAAAAASASAALNSENNASTEADNSANSAIASAASSVAASVSEGNALTSETNAAASAASSEESAIESAASAAESANKLPLSEVDVEPTNNTVVRRDSSGKVKCTYLFSEGVKSVDPDVNGFVVKNTANDGVMRGCSLSHAKTALNKTSTNWVSKWTGNTNTPVTNTWGDGTFLLKDQYNIHYIINVAEPLSLGSFISGTSYIDGGRTLGSEYRKDTETFTLSQLSTSTNAKLLLNILQIWKEE